MATVCEDKLIDVLLSVMMSQFLLFVEILAHDKTALVA